MIFCLSLIGCSKNSKPTDQTPEVNIIHATKSDPRQGNMVTKLNEFTFDLDGDGTEEIIELHTAAGKAPDGSIAWDDGQNWLLVIVDGNDYYPLLQEYVQLGTVYFTVLDDQKGSVIITAIVETGSGLKLVSYTYNEDQKGYRGEVVYHIGGDQVFNAIRTY